MRFFGARQLDIRRISLQLRGRFHVSSADQDAPASVLSHDPCGNIFEQRQDFRLAYGVRHIAQPQDVETGPVAAFLPDQPLTKTEKDAFEIQRADLSSVEI